MFKDYWGDFLYREVDVAPLNCAVYGDEIICITIKVFCLVKLLLLFLTF